MRKLLFLISAFTALSIGAAAAQSNQPWPSAYGMVGGQGYTVGHNISVGTGGTFIDSGYSQSASPGVTNGAAAAAGAIGEVISVSCPNSSTGTATFTNGSSTIGMATTPPIGCPINFTTSGGLPTNFVVGTNYYVISQVAGVSVVVSAAPGSTAVSAGSAGTGTQTAVYNATMTSTNTVNLLGIALTAGDWTCNGVESWIPTASTTSSLQKIAITQTANDAGTVGAIGTTILGIAFPASTAQTIPVGSTQQLLSATTEVYLNSTPTFAVSTAAADGQMTCRRMH